MYLNKKSFSILFAISLLAILTSCSNSTDTVVPKPVITVSELGMNNTKVAYIGADLHVEAEIVAEGKIDKITVEIHKEGGTGDEIEAEFTEFVGQKNATFHKHVEIPSTTVAGEYHFHLTVIDKEGNSTTFEEEITIKELVDTEAPVLSITTAPTNGQAFANGQISQFLVL